MLFCFFQTFTVTSYMYGQVQLPDYLLSLLQPDYFPVTANRSKKKLSHLFKLKAVVRFAVVTISQLCLKLIELFLVESVSLLVPWLKKHMCFAFAAYFTLLCSLNSRPLVTTHFLPISLPKLQHLGGHVFLPAFF